MTGNVDIASLATDLDRLRRAGQFNPVLQHWQFTGFVPVWRSIRCFDRIFDERLLVLPSAANWTALPAREYGYVRQ
jgi:hypothetical protein